jgi:hypothetical protein
MIALEIGVDATDRLQNSQPRSDRALGIVFVSRRVAEVDKQAVAEVLRHVAVEAKQ